MVLKQQHGFAMVYMNNTDWVIISKILYCSNPMIHTQTNIIVYTKKNTSAHQKRSITSMVLIKSVLSQYCHGMSHQNGGIFAQKMWYFDSIDPKKVVSLWYFIQKYIELSKYI